MNPKGLAALLVAVSVLLLSAARHAWAAPGDLDTTFGTGGGVVTPFGSRQDKANSVALQANGKIVVAGYHSQGRNNDLFAVARYRPDGTLDPTFGEAGKVTTDIGPYSEQAMSVAIQPGGRIVVAGYSDEAPVRHNSDFALVRYKTDGSLDRTFGTNGKVTTSFTPSSDWAMSVAIQPDGKIVTAGGGKVFHQVALARYNTDGTLDRSFSRDGKVLMQFGSSISSAYSATIQEDGRIVVAGEAEAVPNSQFALARFSTDGSLDPTFAGNGKLTTDMGGDAAAASVAIQADGRIVAAGYVDLGNLLVPDFALARYEADGTLDASFDLDGKVTTSFGSGGVDFASGIAVQADGRIVAVGACDACGFGPARYAALARYNADGSLDPSFGTGGTLAPGFGHEANAVAIQADGRIVVVGEVFNGSNDYDFAVARYEA